MANIDIDELRKEIELERKSLADKEAVLRFLEQRTGFNIKNSAVSDSNPLSSGIISLDELIPDAKKRSFVDDVNEVVARFGGQEFTVAHVEAALIKTGTEFKSEKSPRARISTILAKLEHQGVLIATHKGKGNMPNRYKVNATQGLV